MQKHQIRRSVIAATMALGLFAAVGVVEMTTANAEPRPGMYKQKRTTYPTTTAPPRPTTTKAPTTTSTVVKKTR